MEQMYWLTRLDGINNCIVTFIVFSVVFTTVFSIMCLVNKYDTCDEELTKSSANYLKWLYPLTIVLSLVYVFIPSTKDAFLIYGVGGTIDYIKQDSVATQLPHKVLVALDKYVDEITPKE